MAEAETKMGHYRVNRWLVGGILVLLMVCAIQWLQIWRLGNMLANEAALSDEVVDRMERTGKAFFVGQDQEKVMAAMGPSTGSGRGIEAGTTVHNWWHAPRYLLSHEYTFFVVVDEKGKVVKFSLKRGS